MCVHLHDVDGSKTVVYSRSSEVIYKQACRIVAKGDLASPVGPLFITLILEHNTTCYILRLVELLVALTVVGGLAFRFRVFGAREKYFEIPSSSSAS